MTTTVVPDVEGPDGYTALYLRGRSHEGPKQVLLSLVSRPPQEHNAYHPRSTFTRFSFSLLGLTRDGDG